MSYLSNMIMYLDMEKIYNFIMINKYIYIFILITNIIMVFDFRFTYIMKLLVIPSFVIIGTIVLIIINVDNFVEWMKDLFWYTKLLNLSFIVHTCWLNWIYIFFWYYRWERACWIVSRISFIFSMSFILCIINYLHFYLNETIYYKYKMIIHNNKKLIYVYMYSILILCLVKTIIRFFMMIHGNYSIIFMKNSEFFNFSYDRLISLIKIFSFIIITFILSYYIFGICRLYLVWLLLFIYEFLNLFYQYIKNYDKKYKDQGLYKEWNIFRKYIFLNKYIQFFTVYILWNYREDVELVNKNNVEFVYSYIYRSLLTYPQKKFLYINLLKKNFAYADFFKPYKLFFKNREPWINLCRKELEVESFSCNNLERDEKMPKFINDMAKVYNLTELEKQSFIKFYTVDYEKKSRKICVELFGYTEKQIDKFWRGENPYN